jgi:hypothetical protein
MSLPRSAHHPVQFSSLNVWPKMSLKFPVVLESLGLWELTCSPLVDGFFWNVTKCPREPAGAQALTWVGDAGHSPA